MNHQINERRVYIMKTAIIDLFVVFFIILFYLGLVVGAYYLRWYML